MTRLVSKLFNVRPQEWPRLLLLMLMLFLMVAGNTWGQIMAYAGFVNAVGANAVPPILAAAAVLAMVLAAGYSLAADRIVDDRLLIYIAVGATVMIGIGRFLLIWDSLALIAYPLLYVVYSVLILRVLNVHWWTYVNSFYDTRSAKRIVPLVAVSARLGGSMALLIPFLRQYLQPADMILLWLLLLAAVAVLAWAMPILLREKRQTQRSLHITQQQRGGAASYLDNLREGFQYTIGSPFMRRLALAVLLMTVLLELHWFQQTAIMDANVQPGGVFESTAVLESILGSVIGITSILLIPIQLFGLPRLINRLGIGNANLIFPLLTLLLSGVLIYYGLGPELMLLTWPAVIVAALADINRIHIRAAFQSPVDSLLYNAVPLRFKGRARAFVNGLLVPLGVLLSSVLVLVLKDIAIGWLLPLLIGGLAVAYGVAAWAIRQQYGRALIALLEQDDFSSLLPERTIDLAGPLPLADTATLTSLAHKLEASQDSEMAIFMARLLLQVGGANAVPLLQAEMPKRDAHLRATFIRLLVVSEVQGAAVRSLLKAALSDEAGAVRREALVGLRQLAETEMGSDNFLPLAVAYLADPDVSVQGVVLPSLLQAANLTYRQTAEATVTQLLHSSRVSERILGLEALGQIRDITVFLDDVLLCLADEADEVRLTTAVLLETWSQQTLPALEAATHRADAFWAKVDAWDQHSLPAAATQIAAQAIVCLDDPVERVRQAALVILGRLRQPNTYLALAQHLNDDSPDIRQLAADLLVALGPTVIPLLKSQLHMADARQQRMAAIVLGRIDPGMYGGLIAEQIDENLRRIYTNLLHSRALMPLCPYKAVALLCEILAEENGRLTQELFDLLLALHPPRTVDLVRESLHSDKAHVQANALEALESLTSPQTAQLVAPLFKPTLPEPLLHQLAEAQWAIAPPDLAGTLRALATNTSDSWRRCVAVYALGEVGLDWATAVAVAPRAAPAPALLDLPVIQMLLTEARQDRHNTVREMAEMAWHMVTGREPVAFKENAMLSVVERIVFLKEVSFFREMSVDQLRVLANVCEEERFAADTAVYQEGDPGGVLYVIVQGRVGIERAGRRRGLVARLDTLGAHASFGDMNLFDNSPRTASATALEETLVLKLGREPLIALARQYPDLSLALINVLSQRLRQTTERVAELTRSQPRQLHKLFDQFE